MPTNSLVLPDGRITLVEIRIRVVTKDVEISERVLVELDQLAANVLSERGILRRAELRRADAIEIEACLPRAAREAVAVEIVSTVVGVRRLHQLAICIDHNEVQQKLADVGFIEAIRTHTAGVDV